MIFFPTFKDEVEGTDVNKMAERVLLRLQQKLQGVEDGIPLSIEGQVYQYTTMSIMLVSAEREPLAETLHIECGQFDYILY